MSCLWTLNIMLSCPTGVKQPAKRTLKTPPHPTPNCLQWHWSKPHTPMWKLVACLWLWKPLMQFAGSCHSLQIQKPLPLSVCTMKNCLSGLVWPALEEECLHVWPLSELVVTNLSARRLKYLHSVVFLITERYSLDYDRGLQEWALGRHLQYCHGSWIEDAVTREFVSLVLQQVLCFIT